MNKTKGLSWQIAGAVALAALFGTSAFAESSHLDRTGRHNSGARNEQHFRGTERSTQRVGRVGGDRGFRSAERPAEFRGGREFDRGRELGRGREDNRFDRRVDNRFDRRSDNRFDGRFDNRGFRGRSFVGDGRITRLVHENGGYRVWLDRGDFPFFVPEARFLANPLRVGLGVHFGGIFDPLGFVNVNDIGFDGYGPVCDLGGVVERVDFGRGIVVLNNGGRFTTVFGSGLRFGDLRRGDRVGFSGSFGRDGSFRANEIRGARRG